MYEWRKARARFPPTEKNLKKKAMRGFAALPLPPPALSVPGGDFTIFLIFVKNFFGMSLRLLGNIDFKRCQEARDRSRSLASLFDKNLCLFTLYSQRKSPLPVPQIGMR